MKTPKHILMVLGLVLLGVAAVPHAGAFQPLFHLEEDQERERIRRNVTINIQVLDPAGAPVPDASLVVQSRYAYAFGVTGADGRAEIRLNPAESGDNLVIVQFYDGSQEQGVSDDRRRELHARYLELREQYAFRHTYSYNLLNTGSTFGMVIQAAESSVLSGTFLEQGVGVDLFMVAGLVKPAGTPFTSDENGQFSVRIERGTPAQLMYLSPTGQARFLEITGAQSTNDLDLGQIPVLSLANDSTLAVRFAVPGREILDPERLAIVNGQVTMIEASGAYMLTYRTDPGRAFAVDSGWFVNPPPPQVPAGTYYIVAGNHFTKEVEALRLALIDRRQALLDAAGVVSVTVSPTQPGDVVFNAQTNSTAIMSVAQDLVD